MAKPGPHNLISDISGVTVGHATDADAATGVTVLRFADGMSAAVDVRGGAPGTRETDLLAPENLVSDIHAIVLSGGSVFGLGAADEIVAVLARDGVGLRLLDDGLHVPIVPAAVLYDLANAGDKDWGDKPPYRRLGRDALSAAATEFALGAVGAGRGAAAGTEQGGIGSASVDLGEGLAVGALVAVNSLGTVRSVDGKAFHAWPFELNQEFGGERPPTDQTLSDPFPELGRLREVGRAQPGANTTLAVVATSLDLTVSELKRVAIMAHDGLARAIRPSHTPFDGDVVFAVSNAACTASPDTAARALQVARVGSAAADTLARATARGVYAANSPET